MQALREREIVCILPVWSSLKRTCALSSMPRTAKIGLYRSWARHVLLDQMSRPAFSSLSCMRFKWSKAISVLRRLNQSIYACIKTMQERLARWQGY